MVVLSASRGSEAALSLGAYFPRLVHGVIALSPGSVVSVGWDPARHAATHASAWTLRGRPLPFCRAPNGPWCRYTPVGADAASIIPVERIRGPVLTAAGDADRVWPSTVFAEAIQLRLTQHRDSWPHVNYVYPGAGHFVGGLIPNTQIGAAAIGGGDPLIDARARNALWLHVLAFLRTV